MTRKRFLLVLCYVGFLHLLKGQGVCTDVNPDYYLATPPSSVTSSWDIDADGTNDFQLKVFAQWVGQVGSSGATINTLGNNLVVADTVGVFSLVTGDSLSDSRPWRAGNINIGKYSSPGSTYVGHHFGGNIGLKFYKGGVINYGWLEIFILSIGPGNAELYVKSYGYSMASTTVGSCMNAVAEKILLNEVRVSPDPVVDESKIVLPAAHQGTYWIYSIDGKLVSEKKYSASEEIKLIKSDFTSGVYFYRITSFDKVITGKFIVD